MKTYDERFEEMVGHLVKALEVVMEIFSDRVKSRREMEIAEVEAIKRSKAAKQSERSA